MRLRIDCDLRHSTSLSLELDFNAVNFFMHSLTCRICKCWMKIGWFRLWMRILRLTYWNKLGVIWSSSYGSELLNVWMRRKLNAGKVHPSLSTYYHVIFGLFVDATWSWITARFHIFTNFKKTRIGYWYYFVDCFAIFHNLGAGCNW